MKTSRKFPDNIVDYFISQVDTKALHRDLNEEESINFIEWARKNWKAGDKVELVWHPVVVRECAKMLDRHIRAHIRIVDLEKAHQAQEEMLGTIERQQKLGVAKARGDTVFTYKEEVCSFSIADSPEPTCLSEHEMLDLAVEYFWEKEWDKAIGNS
tara:strand:- start:72 stop:539 length:468 start_codon:yes stop_codon:yes gene_type:complete